MSDVFDTAKRSEVMRAVKGRNTSPEVAVRRLVWRLGGRYRLHARNLPGSPDLVLPRRRLALFVHGCFWHGHDCARGARTPKANRDYWTAKLARNRARDAAALAALAGAGWRAEVVWECELREAAALETRIKAMLDFPAVSP